MDKTFSDPSVKPWNNRKYSSQLLLLGLYVSFVNENHIQKNEI